MKVRKKKEGIKEELSELKTNKKVARLYKRKNARVKKALSFSTPKNTKLT